METYLGIKIWELITLINSKLMETTNLDNKTRSKITIHYHNPEPSQPQVHNSQLNLLNKKY